jgi:NAD(P)H-dependent flavin oxidoreductase YrpB (nitropropane dioxygenase family)
MTSRRLDILARLGLELPILQVGMGGGLATAELAAAVSLAGGLGTIGTIDPPALDREIRRARDLAPGKPIAVNLLVPLARRAHVEACIAARVAAVVLFFGFDRAAVARLRAARILVLHQVGTVAEARRALEQGADALIAQGVEGGGHLLGREPARAFLPRVLEIADGAPVFLAGGIAEAEDVRAALEAGAAGVSCGTRFLLTEECLAHPEYKRRALGAERTIVTELFGFGWPARHRVLPNGATERWCARREAGPRVARWLNTLSKPIGRWLPQRHGVFLARVQRRAVPLFSPFSPVAGMDAGLVEVTALYAGESARRVRRVLPAAEAVRMLAMGCPGRR